ncbi:L-carnitine dehydrogenase [bioreactor metagenome]|uniref:L-carnitine dehydrogenase n=1 Tax=bioreactor metagenome TaxID=1076179 RepID=A0A644XJ06_9ZZZZ
MNAKDIKNVTCIATGVIGSSWATNFAMKGYTVSVYDIDDGKLSDAKAFVEKNLNYLSKKNLLSKGQVAETLGNMTFTTNVAEAVKNAQFIQESGPENYAVKRSIIESIEAYAPKDAIIASSTSGLSITEISKDMKHPERLVVGHPYNPPHLIPLVDICKGEQTSEEVAQCAYDFYTLLGKEPVMLKKEALGFIANRLQMALWREATEMVHRGICSLEDIDKAVVFGPGLRWALMGPGLCFQLSGGNGGIEGLLHHLEPSWNLWLDDMADWHQFPYSAWPVEAQEGINQEKANRASTFGNTDKEITAWRDDALIEILKIHSKL